MAGWTIPNAVRSKTADAKAQKLAQCMVGARSFKEAAWRAGIPVRTASRLRARLD